MELSELTNEEGEENFRSSDEEEENPKAPEEEDPRNEEGDLRASQTKGLGKQHPYFKKRLEQLGKSVPKIKKGAAILDRFDVIRKKWESVDCWLKPMIKAYSEWEKRELHTTYDEFAYVGSEWEQMVDVEEEESYQEAKSFDKNERGQEGPSSNLVTTDLVILDVMHLGFMIMDFINFLSIDRAHFSDMPLFFSSLR